KNTVYERNPGSAATYSTSPVIDWSSDYTYDMDGNLLKLNRIGGDVPPSVSTQWMDQLSYEYTPGTNQLVRISDSILSTVYKIDIHDDPSDGSIDYEYDENGQLIKDHSSGLSTIDWTRTGKVWRVYKTGGQQLHFTYDALGN